MNSQPLINNTIKKIASLQVPHQQSIDAAVRRQSQLTKPEGALGKLEILAEFIAGVAAVPNPTLQRKTIMLLLIDSDPPLNMTLLPDLIHKPAASIVTFGLDS